MKHTSGVPLGIKALRSCGSAKDTKQRMTRYQFGMLVLTFLTYMCYHMTRKPTSIVKAVLNPKVDFNGHGDPTSDGGWYPFDTGSIVQGYHALGKANLGMLDTVFLFAYAIGMFFSGHVGDRSNLRYFLTFGMLGSGLLCALFGMGFFWNVHTLWYFLFIQGVYGFYQSTGWPSVVSVMGKWFPRGKRGLLMGIWNAHTSVGNILGALIPGAVLTYGWGWAFVVPGAIIAFFGIVVFFFLVVFPNDVDLPNPDEMEEDKSKRLLLNGSEDSEYNELAPKHHKAISFLSALKIPGVIDFSLGLFFVKLVAYTFLFWLPYYVKHNPIAGKTLSASQSAYISTLFDVGGIAGGVVAGYVSDKTKRPATITVVYLLISVPILFVYHAYGHENYGITVGLLLLSGFFVNGPYALITTAVSADLGTHESLQGNPLALATVTAIIDGTGSIGAAIGPYLAGSIPGWSNVFYMLMGSLGCAGLVLIGAIAREWKTKNSTHSKEYVIAEE
eukprot:m.87190 g.87190  ORF g.87190 m.87190 type:complete len:501 (+) comp8784_c1_seq3:176-1678(+)